MIPLTALKLQPRSRSGWSLYGGTAAVCLAMALAAYLLFLGPGLAENRTLANRAQELDEQRQALAKRSAILAGLKRELIKAHAAVGRTSIQLEPARQINQRLSRLAASAGESGLRIDSIQPGTPRPGPQCQTVRSALAARRPIRPSRAFCIAFGRRFPIPASPGSNCPPMATAAPFPVFRWNWTGTPPPEGLADGH